jgi:ring-1,2-phenylacetyl-CoA epoxidase subunit PaaE
VFNNPENGLKYKPGQFLTIINHVDGKKLRRAYSLCSTPFNSEDPAVTVKRVENGSMSNFINDNFKEGMEVEVMEPMGMFTPEISENKSRRAIFFAGGSGITPIYSLIKSMLLKEPKSTLTLIYGNRNKEYIIFHKELKALSEKHDNFTVKHILQEDSDNIADYVGLPDQEMIHRILRDVEADKDSEVYICGPQPMMDLVNTTSIEYGISQDKISFESFVAGKTSPSEIFEDNSSDDSLSEVLIILDGEEHTISVSKGRPILEQALEQGIDMPYSCQSGLCTACRGKCLEGEISTDKVEGLSQEEIDEGYRLTCVGIAKTDSIKIEIG